ncbi:uncharacterized protein BJ212DRAFT_782129 [Suillus subaureus]|uniref:Uncharacterized protein n=1 Tax=Suillus subaureus TaxID=48587 RepID=A0A9P7ANR7_9AGAM|nr:uncharacterized protein BJ212DRAFT_782129 [Suillus subaureus]KAG1793046.1 hypothetical protein BJ212DRAFT_782129 [Suillus subaureus]
MCALFAYLYPSFCNTHRSKLQTTSRYGAKCGSQHHRSSSQIQIPHTGEIHRLPCHHLLFQSSALKLDRKLQTVSLATWLCDDIQRVSRADVREATLDLRADSFAHGQLYTTLSRVRCWQDVRTLFAR